MELRRGQSRRGVPWNPRQCSYRRPNRRQLLKGRLPELDENFGAIDRKVCSPTTVTASEQERVQSKYLDLRDLPINWDVEKHGLHVLNWIVALNPMTLVCGSVTG